MPVSPARAAAFEILMRIEKTDAYASEMLHSAQFAKLAPADHGLMTELVMGVLRWRSVLDVTIADSSATPSVNSLLVKAGSSGVPQSGGTHSHPRLRFDREVLTALRLGSYQLLFLDRVPRHAAVNESVELVKRARKRSAAGLVNAVLRKITPAGFNPDNCAAHPQWTVERWQREYGVEITRKICSYDQAAPKATIRTPPIPQPSDTAKAGAAVDQEDFRWIGEQLRSERIQLVPGRLLTRAAVVVAGDITRTVAYRERRLVIQDEASQLVALLAGRGQKILDCCAAPGGKTRILAEQNPEAEIVATELHPHRAALLKKLVPTANVKVIVGDARAMPFRSSFDCVLVDAPCSGTGTLARNPDIKWRLNPGDLHRLQAYQIEILRSAMQALSPGGRLVYSTCSLEPEENEAVIQNVLTDSFRVINCRQELLRVQSQGELAWNDIDALVRGPYLRTLPGVHPCDGFFAAILAK
jgi:16S rRNA (cytosine967-C5)-methyltransferase